MSMDIPPKVWLPSKPAIIRPAPVKQANFLPGMFPVMFPVISAGIPSDTFLGFNSSTTNATNWTFSSSPLGTPHSSRHIVLGAFCGHATAQRTLTATCRGNSMTSVVSTQISAFIPTYLFIINDTSANTTGDIVVTANASSNNIEIGLWAIYDLASSTATDTANAINATAIDLDCNVVSPGIAIVFGGSVIQNFVSLTGVNEDFSEDSGESDFAGGMSTGLATETPRQLGITWTGQSNNERGVAATWQKN